MIIDIPSTVNKALFELNHISPTVIAGGFLRDQICGNEVKDIDFFVYGSLTPKQIKQVFDVGDNDIILNNGIKVGGQEKPMIRMRSIAEAYNPYKNKKVHTVFDVLLHDSQYPVQVICVDTPVIEYIEQTFAVGLSMIWYDGNLLHKSKEFNHDYSSKQLTIRSNYSGFDQTMKYVERIHKKYPNHKVVVDFESPHIKFEE